MVGNGDVLLDLLDVAGVDGTKAIIMAVDGALLQSSKDLTPAHGLGASAKGGIKSRRRSHRRAHGSSVPSGHQDPEWDACYWS